MHQRHALRTKRHQAIRHKIIGTATRPRLSVYRGLNHMYAQFIDDITGTTILGMSDKPLVKKETGTARAQALGKALATAAIAKGIKACVFDRGGFQYHGQIKAFADAVREAGITV